MTAVSAPPVRPGVTPQKAIQAPSGNNAPNGNDEMPADFALMLKNIQALATDPANPTDNDSGGPSAMAAVISEIRHGQAKNGKTDEDAKTVDIAAILGQINVQPNPQTIIPAAPAAPIARPEDVNLFEDDKVLDSSGRGRDIAAIATQNSATEDATALFKKDRVEPITDFFIPESPASTTPPTHNMNAAQSHGPHTETTKLDVATPVHSPNWSAEVGQRVVWMAKNDVQEAQLSVNPPHLGPIEITLSLKDDNATAHFSSPHAEIRAALEEALPRLREMLAGAGVQLGQSDVGAQSQQAFQQFSDKQKGAGHDQPSFNDEHPSLHAQNAVNHPVIARAMKGNGLVDTFV